MHLCILRDIMICEAIFRGRDLIFCGEPHINIYFADIKYFLNLDNLEPVQKIIYFLTYRNEDPVIS